MPSFLSGIYSRVTAAWSQPADGESDSSGTRTLSPPPAPSESSRTLSPEGPSFSQAPPTPFFPVPSTPFAGVPSPVHHEAAAEQLKREILGGVPETPAPAHGLAQPTPMTRYHTPALPHFTPAVSTSPQTSKRQEDGLFQTPLASPSKRLRIQHTPAHRETQMMVGHLELEQQTADQEASEDREVSEASVSSPDEEDEEMETSSSELEEMDTSSTSVSSSVSDHPATALAMAIPSHKTRKHPRRPQRPLQSRSYDDRRARVKKGTRPAMSRSISGREELLNKARKRFWDRRADGDRLF